MASMAVLIMEFREQVIGATTNVCSSKIFVDTVVTYNCVYYENYQLDHGLRTPNEGINQRNLKFWADVADKIGFGRTYRIVASRSTS